MLGSRGCRGCLALQVCWGCGTAPGRFGEGLADALLPHPWVQPPARDPWGGRGDGQTHTEHQEGVVVVTGGPAILPGDTCAPQELLSPAVNDLTA